MRYSLSLLLLAIITSTSYGQMEDLLLLPLGTPQQQVADSVRTILARAEPPDSWDLLTTEENLFGLPAKEISIKFFEGRLESVDMMIELDSLSKAMTAHEKAMEYIVARLGPEKVFAESDIRENNAGFGQGRWQMPDGYVIIDSRRMGSRRFTVRITHKARGY